MLALVWLSRQRRLCGNFTLENLKVEVPHSALDSISLFKALASSGTTY